MDLAAVDANRALAEQRIVGGRLLHFRDYFGAVIALERLDRFQVVDQRRVDAGVDHRRMDALVALGEALGKRSRLVVRVPVERVGDDQPLRSREAKRMNVREEYQQAG